MEMNEQLLQVGSEKLAQALARATTKTEKEFSKRTQGKSEEEAAKIKQELLSKHLQSEMKTTVYSYVGGFQPTQGRYWADVGIKATANALVLFGAVATGAMLLRSKSGTHESGSGDNSNPFAGIDNVTASARPSARKSPTAV